jgi:N-acyl amino acid synthase of PEP-CTERM/exosortase system
MELKLLRMLHGMGIHFIAVGPQVMHHGLRQQCYCNLKRMLEDLRREQPEYWNVITDGGILMPGARPAL